VFVTLSTGVIAALMMTARIQTAYWRDNETLWSHTLACTENNYIAQNNLGNALLEKGLLDAAVAHFQSALDINPGSAEPHNNLGNALHQEGHLDEAIAQYQKALDLWPSYAEAHYDLGNALSDKGQLDEAITHFQKALDLKPHQAKTYNNLALTLEQKGRLDEAIANYHKSLEFKPDFVEAQNNLANLLATTRNARLRNGVEALNLAQRANQLTGGNNPAILGTLAAAYAEQGRFPEAVETVQRAVQLAETQNNPTLSNFLRQHLKIYQAGKPLRRD